ncbi:nucleotidyltransferase family protein [Acidaminobacter hydrogenoformans]|uniref:Polymerase beta nucleotidyltransferase domain-containing protein n=1 Tax=Acidaminobacter hydrogenoformans DSM 2784 TaxID=1120920 RepID=A0A1G5RTE9_9FIRM|nr:nucleotidyltransferase domain-containing protein [Acidaminobacter hydrogenoformans]SCZ77364.1 hypothetical protein SAMN03080599_00744 [Acidaminobacter hydrogenoformans DSM 2784]
MRQKTLTPSEIAAKAEQLFNQYGVRKAALFGSYSRNEMKIDSDIDILIDFDFADQPYAFIELQQRLEKLFKRKVDLISLNSLKLSKDGEKIMRESTVIYERH